MTFDEFVAKYNTKGIDEDGGYGFQCVDLVNQYVKEVLGLQRWPGNAIDKWENYPQEDYDRIANTPDNAPQEGDIIIWGGQMGQYGHIGVCKSGTNNNFISFDQNWPVGSVSHLVMHTFFGVLGWLRPKRKDDMSQPEREELDRLRAFKKEIVENKINEFRHAGDARVYQIYAIPTIEHFNFLGDDMENVREIPADWPIEPREWNGQREYLRPTVNQLQGVTDDINHQLAESFDEKTALQKQLADCEATPMSPCPECPDCPPAIPCPEIPVAPTVPVIEMKPAKPASKTLEDVIISFFKSLTRKN